MNTIIQTSLNAAGDAAALPDVSELLAVAGQLLADVAQHIATARAMLRELADTDAVHGVGELLAVAGWLADFGAKLAGEPGLAALDLAGQDALWDMAKAEERSGKP